MLGAFETTFLVLVVVFSPVGARHAVPERAISMQAPSTETALPMFAFEFSMRDKCLDNAKFVRRARHVADPACVRGAVPLLSNTSH
ncbi:MAG: hypothetical protein WBQ04_02715, partial [Candidatus Acidiferrales bacterium]